MPTSRPARLPIIAAAGLAATLTVLLGGPAPAQAQCPPTTAPTALSPSGTVTSDRPTFTWTGVPGASSYTLYVFRVSDEAILIRQTDIAGTSFTPGPAQALPTGVELRWKVKGESGCGAGPYSAHTFFTVASLCPPSTAPTAFGPTGTINTQRPTFSWSAVPGATSYTLYVVRVSDEAILVHQVGLTTTSFTPATALPADIDLRWKVKGESPCGPGPYSAILPFRIALCSVPGVPVTQQPSGAITTQTPTFSWTAAAGATSYTLEVVRASDGAAILQRSGIGGTGLVSPVALPAGVDLRWRVRGDNACGAGGFSAPRTFRVTPPCNLPGVPVARQPSGTVAARIVTFTWDAVAGATSYTLEVARAAGGVLLTRTGLTTTSFTPPTPLQLDLPMVWRVRAHNGCGPGAFSANLSFVLSPPHVPGDTDGDGTVDTVTAVLGGVQIFHPALGTTRLYPMTNRQFSIHRVVQTDGRRGDEVVVLWAGVPGVSGIDVIHDATGVVSGYPQNRQFAVQDIVDTDGNPGAEIIVGWTGVPGVSGIDVIHDAGGGTAIYQQNRQFQIVNISDLNGQPGAEITVSFAGVPGVNGIQVIRDRTRATANYQQNRQFQLAGFIDTDGQPGNEIVVSWAGVPGFNGIDIIHDSTGRVALYQINANFQISTPIRDLEGQPGADVCYSFFQPPGVTRFNMIVDRTGQTVSRPSCQ
jgi:hypothetical protein